MSLVPAKFRFTTKEKSLMIVIMILMVVGIVVTWINCIENMKANAEYKLAYQQYQEALIKEQEELERKRQEKLPKLTEAGIENINHIYSSDTKRVFLTFDDGPSSNTNQILDILNENGSKALEGEERDIFNEEYAQIADDDNNQENVGKSNNSNGEQTHNINYDYNISKILYFEIFCVIINLKLPSQVGVRQLVTGLIGIILFTI